MVFWALEGSVRCLSCGMWSLLVVLRFDAVAPILNEQFMYLFDLQLDTAAQVMVTTKNEYRTRGARELTNRLDATSEALEQFTRGSNVGDLEGLGALLAAKTEDL
jgi:hypothetical protein